jgi:hypothetical protein
MRTPSNLPVEAALILAWRRIDPASKVAFIVTLAVSVLAFGFEMTNLSLHHDDVNQIFIESTILGHYLGRFGLGWLHHYVQGHYFMPFLQLAQGMVMMALYGVIVARFWGATKALDIALAACILCVFPYMAQVYQYNTSMATSSAAHLLAAAAVVLSVRGSVAGTLAGAFLYLAAFSIYQGVAANAVVILLVWLLTRLLFVPQDKDGPVTRDIARSVAAALLAALVGGALYYLAVSFMTIEYDPYQSAEKALTPGAGIDLARAVPAIIEGTRSFYFWPETYFPGALKNLQLLFLGGAGLVCLMLPKQWWARSAALGLLVLICFAPRSLQLLHAEGNFHELTLTGYALVIAAALTIALRSAPMLLRNGATVMAALTIAAYVVQCNWVSTVAHLNTLAHHTTLTQILARVRSLPDTNWDGKTIAVVGQYDMRNDYPFKPATGVAVEFMRAHHMDKLARLMRDEANFIDADDSMPMVMEYAATHKAWPNPQSVGIVDGIGVVILSNKR